MLDLQSVPRTLNIVCSILGCHSSTFSGQGEECACGAVRFVVHVEFPRTLVLLSAWPLLGNI
jgi:hypothetical protein